MLSVYLVDDEPMILRGLTKLIDWEKYGFQISGMSNSGKEALDHITIKNTDIVITDLKMPDINGIELCERLHKMYPGMKFIVLSAYDDFEYMQKSIRNGVSDYLLKPVKEKTLLESLRQVREDMDQEQYNYPFEIEHRLIENILKNNKDEVKNELDQLFENIEMYKVQLPTFKKISNGLLKSLNYRLEQEGSGLKEILNDNILNKDVFSESLTMEDVYKKLDSILNKVSGHRNGKQENDLITKIKKYISDNLDKDLSLNTVTNCFYVNSSYLSQVFKKFTGKNYTYYVTEQRMLYAKRLLKDNNLQIQQISELAGYTDYRYFSQTFKKIIGKTPSEYRSELQEEKA